MAEKIKLYLISFSDAFGTFLTRWCLEKPSCNSNLFSVVSESFFFLPDGVSVGNLFGLRLLYDSNGFRCIRNVVNRLFVPVMGVIH